MKEFATITPKRVTLRGPVGKNIKASVSIIPWEKYAFRIIDVKAKSGDNISFKLEEVKKAEGLEYKLTVENLKKVQGFYLDTIILKTDSKIRPEIKLRVSGNISAENIAIIKPSKVILQGPAGEPIKMSVSIIPEEKHPFNILEAKAKIGENISYRLEKAGNSKEQEYILTIENLKKEKGNYSDIIFLKTDIKAMPEQSIKIFGMIFGSEDKEIHDMFKQLFDQPKQVERGVPGR